MNTCTINKGFYFWVSPLVENSDPVSEVSYVCVDWCQRILGETKYSYMFGFVISVCKTKIHIFNINIIFKVDFQKI